MSDKPNYTRIDLFQMPDGSLRVMKFTEGWTIGSAPAANYLTTQQTLDQASTWLEQHGWTVRRWPGGARAWKGELQPIRSRGQVLRKRDEMTMHRNWYPELQIHALNLALDF